MKRAALLLALLLAAGCGPPTGPAPQPPDVLSAAVVYGYAKEQGKAKASEVKALAAVYRAAAQGPLVDAPALKNLSDLEAALHAAATALLPDDALKGLRQDVLASAWAEELGRQDRPLTPELRQKARKLCARIAAALEALP